MKLLMDLVRLATGGTLAEEDETPARRAQLAILALCVSLVMASLWGLAAGSSVPTLAIHNAYKLPLMVLLAGISAVPVGLLSWKIAGVPQKARELLYGYALSVFIGCCVLTVLSPLVALYYFSSTTAGPVFAMGTVFLGMLVASFTFVRVVRARLHAETGQAEVGWRPAVPGIILAITFVATLGQLIALFAPILPESTPLRGGIDELVQH
jgi:hypothetical protein